MHVAQALLWTLSADTQILKWGSPGICFNFGEDGKQSRLFDKQEHWRDVISSGHCVSDIAQSNAVYIHVFTDSIEEPKPDLQTNDIDSQVKLIYASSHEQAWCPDF